MTPAVVIEHRIVLDERLLTLLASYLDVKVSKPDTAVAAQLMSDAQKAKIIFAAIEHVRVSGGNYGLARKYCLEHGFDITAAALRLRAIRANCQLPSTLSPERFAQMQKIVGKAREKLAIQRKAAAYAAQSKEKVR